MGPREGLFKKKIIYSATESDHNEILPENQIIKNSGKEFFFTKK